MAKLVGMYDYPFTGGQERSLESSFVSAAGLPYDRALVLYDASKPRGKRNRVSRKNAQIPELARVRAEVTGDGSVITLRSRVGKPLRVPFQVDTPPNCIVNEFDRETPAIDVGDMGRKWFADEFIKIRENKNIRLAQKTSAWLLGFGTPPPERSVKAFHIVTLQSIKAAQAANQNPNALYNRYRPNFVLDVPELPAASERTWSVIKIGELSIGFNKHTVRCEYIEQDPNSGKDLDDNDRLGLPNKNEFGIYADPILLPGDFKEIAVGDEVEITEWQPQVA